MPRKSVTFNNTAYTASFRITSTHERKVGTVGQLEYPRYVKVKDNSPIRAPLRSTLRLLRRSMPVPRSFHWFCSLSTYNFPRTLWIVSSSSSPVNTKRRENSARSLQRPLKLHIRSCSAHFPPVFCSPQTPAPPSVSSSSSPPEPEPALNRSPKLFSSPTLPSRQLPLSPYSPGAKLSLSPRARFAAGAPPALKRLWDPPVAYMANGFDRDPVPGPGDPERRTGERVRAAADENGEAAAAKASNPVRLAGVGLAARWTGELGTVLGGEPGRKEDMVNGEAAFEVVGGVAIVFVIVIVELFVRV